MSRALNVSEQEVSPFGRLSDLGICPPGSGMYSSQLRNFGHGAVLRWARGVRTMSSRLVDGGLVSPRRNSRAIIEDLASLAWALLGR
jgi:hypothetical protein